MKLKLICSCLLIVNSAIAQYTITPYDINAGTGSSQPIVMTPFNGKLYFHADDGIHGRELMVTDTSSAPALVADIYSGSTPGCPVIQLNEKMAVANNASGNPTLYFAAGDGITGTELYQCGTTGAPSLAKDIFAGISGSSPQMSVTMNGKVYFMAVMGGEFVWEYDPVTTNVRSLDKIATGAILTGISKVVAFKNKIFICASTATLGSELWKYDPVTDSITLAMDINPGASGSFPIFFIPIGNKLYFAATTAANGREIHAYDNTTGTITRMTDLNPGPASSVTALGNWILGELNGVIYYAGDSATVSNQLFKYDPATNKASMVANLNPGGSGSVDCFATYKNKIYFRGSDAANPNVLWACDGKSAPKIVKDSITGNMLISPREMTVLGNYLFINATGPTIGSELYKLKDNSVAASGISNTTLSAQSMQLYPNPARETITITLNCNYHNATITLRDVAGKVVLTKPVDTNMFSVNTSSIPKGTYFVTVISDSNTETQKLILE